MTFVSRSTLRALAAALAFTLPSAHAAQYGNAFTYQGSLKASGVAVGGTAAMQFAIYDVESGGVPLVAPIVLPAVPVTDGVFSVDLDFGTLPQSKNERWLEIVVNSTILAPRQKLVPAPIAQAVMRAPLVFAGQIQESPYPGGQFASPMGITEAFSSEARAQMVMPVDCVARNLYVQNLSTSGYPSTTAMLRVNNADTALTCAQVDPTKTCSNVANAVAITAGSLVAVRFSGLPQRPVTNSEAETRGFAAFGFVCE